jgi:ADP-sugar diphosphatase
MSCRLQSIDDEIRLCRTQLQSIHHNTKEGLYNTPLKFGSEPGKDYYVSINGYPILLTWKHETTETEKNRIYTDIHSSKAFIDWKKNIEGNLTYGKYDMKTIKIEDVNMFGERVGFLKVEADIRNSIDMKIPGVSLLRGNSVAMLMILLDENNQRHTILTVQPRVPTGNMNFTEIPAGMMDGHGDFSGVAAKEIKEEVGIDIDTKDLFNLTTQTGGLYTSPGVLDENIQIFLFVAYIKNTDLLKLNSKCTGVIEEGETIMLKVSKYEDTIRYAPDMKTMCAVHLYEQLPYWQQRTPTYQKDSGIVKVKE